MLRTILYADALCVQSQIFDRTSVLDTEAINELKFQEDTPHYLELSFRQAHSRQPQEGDSGPACGLSPLVLTNESFLPRYADYKELDRRKEAARIMHERHGQSGMSSRAQRNIKRLIAAAEYSLGRKHLAMLTVTLDEHVSQLVQDDKIPLFTKNLRNVFLDAMKSRGLQPIIVGVIEVQPKRLAQSGKVCYHWHFVIHAREGRSKWAFTTHEWNALVHKAIWRTFPDRRGVMQSGWVDVQPIRKSAVSYLGKYMTKGVEMVDEVRSVDPDHKFPKRWWVASREVRDIEKSMQVEIDPDKNQLFIEAVRRDLPEQILWERDVEVPVLTWAGGYGDDDDEVWDCDLLTVGRIVAFSDYSTVALYALSNGYTSDASITTDTRFVLQDTRR